MCHGLKWHILVLCIISRVIASHIADVAHLRRVVTIMKKESLQVVQTLRKRKLLPNGCGAPQVSSPFGQPTMWWVSSSD